jgi:hypothetical protein
MTDPTSRQRGRPKKQDSNFEKKNIWSNVPDLGLADRQSQCDFDFDFVDVL